MFSLNLFLVKTILYWFNLPETLKQHWSHSAVEKLKYIPCSKYFSEADGPANMAITPVVRGDKKGSLSGVEARGLVLIISWPLRLPCDFVIKLNFRGLTIWQWLEVRCLLIGMRRKPNLSATFVMDDCGRWSTQFYAEILHLETILCWVTQKCTSLIVPKFYEVVVNWLDYYSYMAQFIKYV